MASLCREFGISRKTGYKIFERCEECGLEGLSDRARRPSRYANELPNRWKRQSWQLGARNPTGVHARFASAWCDDCSTASNPGLQYHPRRAGSSRLGDAQQAVANPYRGHPAFPRLAPERSVVHRLLGRVHAGRQALLLPLTVTDYASRFLLLCEAMESNAEKSAFTAFEQLFQQRGLPRAIRSDNGVPFASPNGLFNLSKLSVWWLRLGISIERIRPRPPQQNGRHERMHLTLKQEATRPAGANILQQQAKFDKVIYEFNSERPHEALAMKCPAQLYTPSPRPYQGIPEPHYPFHDRTVNVTSCSRLCLYRKKINLSTSLAGQAVGVREVESGILAR